MSVLAGGTIPKSQSLPGALIRAKASSLGKTVDTDTRVEQFEVVDEDLTSDPVEEDEGRKWDHCLLIGCMILM